MTHNRFDPAFYERFYANPRTRVTTPQEMARRAAAVRVLVKAFPAASYTGIEVSEHLCKRLGWTQASLATYRPRGRFDLIICYDVLQYLPDAAAARAMANLGRLCRGVLYFHAPTRGDWQQNADLSCSDSNIHLRDADWYRTRLARGFDHVGFGLHVRRGIPYVQWELEQP